MGASLFISDLHLQAGEPATFEAWRHYLESTPADAVFILGDLFEALLPLIGGAPKEEAEEDNEGEYDPALAFAVRGRELATELGHEPMAAVMRAVEDLPLVPTTWIDS